MPQTDSIPARVRFLTIMERVFRRWLLLFLLIFSLFNLLPLLAPTAMHNGFSGIGNLIYDLYGTISHQFANRSYFFYGEHVMYAAEELPLEFTRDINEDEGRLKQYRGDEVRGWKVAWSDRLLAMFGSMLVSAAAYALLSMRRKPGRIPLWLAILLITPLIIDGMTHSISDTNSLFEGFRYTNEWLASLTGNAFSPTFYQGSGLGSFNAWMRLITGVLFGIGLVGYTFPMLDRYFNRNADILREKLTAWHNRRKDIPTNG